MDGPGAQESLRGKLSAERVSPDILWVRSAAGASFDVIMQEGLGVDKHSRTLFRAACPVAPLALQMHSGNDVDTILFNDVDQPVGETRKKIAPETAFDPTPEQRMLGYLAYGVRYRIKEGLPQGRLTVFVESSRLARLPHGFGVEDRLHLPRPFRISLNALAAGIGLRLPRR